VIPEVLESSGRWDRLIRGALPLCLCGALGCAPARARLRTALDDDFAALLGGAAADTGATAPTRAAWQRARERLGALRRESQGAGARTLRVRLELREPRTGPTLEARGAVAVAPSLDGGAPGEPPGALRMILLGPGGTTALDLWARGDRFRFAVPAIGLLRRGAGSTPRASLRGLPVDFLRWWLLHPASGELLWHERIGSTDAFVLRDGEAILELRAVEGGAIGARRSLWLDGRDPRLVDQEVVIADRIGCGTIRYAQASTGLLVTVRCEGEERAREPNPRAFEDPDGEKP